MSTLTISDSCSCGAEFAMTDAAGTYIKSGGELVNGRKYVIQQVYAEWLGAHKPCREREGK